MKLHIPILMIVHIKTTILILKLILTFVLVLDKIKIFACLFCRIRMWLLHPRLSILPLAYRFDFRVLTSPCYFQSQVKSLPRCWHCIDIRKLCYDVHHIQPLTRGLVNKVALLTSISLERKVTSYNNIANDTTFLRSLHV